MFEKFVLRLSFELFFNSLVATTDVVSLTSQGKRFLQNKVKLLEFGASHDKRGVIARICVSKGVAIYEKSRHVMLSVAKHLKDRMGVMLRFLRSKSRSIFYRFCL